MAYLLTDAGEFRPLPCPAIISIGRATDNDFRPESQSVSKRHAIMQTSFVHGTQKIEVTIEDLKSTNGTFVGESPLDFEPVNAKRKISFGTYIRFGFSQKYFRLVDRITDVNLQPDEVELIASPVAGKTQRSEAPAASQASIARHSNSKESFQMLRKTNWSGAAEADIMDNNKVYPPLLLQNISSEKSLQRMRLIVDKMIPFTPFDEKMISLTEYLSSLEGIREDWKELFAFEQQLVQEDLKNNEFINYLFNVKLLSDLSKTVNQAIETDDTLLIDLLLASQKCDLQSFIHDISKAITVFQKFLIISVRSEVLYSDKDGVSNEVSTALLAEISSTISSCCQRIASHETLSMSRMIESCYRKEAGPDSTLELFLISLQSIAGHLNNVGFSILIPAEIKTIMFNCIRLFIEANILFTCYYVVFISVYVCLQDKLQVYMKSKHGDESKALLENFKQAVLHNDDSKLNRLIEDLRRKDQQVIGRRNMKLLRCAKIFTDQNAKKCLNKWRRETITSKQCDLLLFDKVEYSKLNKKRECLEAWRKCFTNRLQLRKRIQRMVRSLSSNGFKCKLIAFRTWLKTVSSERKNIPELTAVKLECVKLQNELDEIRNNDNVADSLAAEKALNRELHSANIGLRTQVQALENKLLHCSSASPVERRDIVFRHLMSKEEKIAALERELKLVNDELESIRAKLSFNGPSIASNSFPPKQGKRNTPLPKMVLKEKDQALGIIIHEVRRLREGYSQMKEEKETLSQQITESKLSRLDFERANQKLSSRVIALERSGALLKELLRQKMGNEGLLEIVDALKTTSMDTSALLNCDINSKLIEFNIRSSDGFKDAKYHSLPSDVEEGGEYEKHVRNLYSK